MNKIFTAATVSLILNVAFSVYYLALGITSPSWWLLTLGFYYLILSIVRFTVILASPHKHHLTALVGWMLMFLSLPLSGTVILAVLADRGQKHHMIVMIAIAVFSFTKITLAIINIVKCRRSASEKLIALRCISLADAFVSIFALQRSMLVSFEGMGESEIVIMNAALGSAVCVIVFLLGLNLVKRKKLLFKL